MVTDDRPKATSLRFNIIKAITLPVSATPVKTEFLLPDVGVYDTHLHELYADARTGLTYEWQIDGQPFPTSLVKFASGRQMLHTLVLVMTNTSSKAWTITAYAEGWGNYKGRGA